MCSLSFCHLGTPRGRRCSTAKQTMNIPCQHLCSLNLLVSIPFPTSSLTNFSCCVRCWADSRTVLNSNIGEQGLSATKRSELIVSSTKSDCQIPPMFNTLFNGSFVAFDKAKKESVVIGKILSCKTMDDLTSKRVTVRQPGIEPGAQRWQRWILPLNHWRLMATEVLRCFINSLYQALISLCM